MLKVEALIPEARELAPSLCGALEGTAFVLAGGTGLALQLGHRISVDFDWFCQPAQYPESVKARLAGLGSRLTVIQDRRHTFECLLGGVRCAFFAYGPKLGAADEPFHDRPIAPIEDIGVMKLVAVSQRGAKKDFFDLYEIVRLKGLRAIVRRASEMLAGEPVNPVHIAKSLVYFDDAEGDPEPLVLSGTDWDTVKAFFAARVRDHTEVLRSELSEA